MSVWQVQTAKQRLSEVLRQAEAGEPQFIMRHGETVAVVVDIADNRKTHVEHEDKPTLLEFLLDGPKFDNLEDFLPPRIGLGAGLWAR